MNELSQAAQTALWYFNTAFNILEFFVIIWVIRDRRVLVTTLKQLAITVCQLSASNQQQPPATTTVPPATLPPTLPATPPAQDVK